MKNIIETIINNPEFTTLLTAIKEAELVNTLSSSGPFTVFAPTDEAFAKISKKDLKDLLDDRKALVSTLTYHVVAGKVSAKDVMKIKEAVTVQGDKVKINIKNEEVMINDAKVTKADIECSNGVIHVIDTVLTL